MAACSTRILEPDITESYSMYHLCFLILFVLFVLPQHVQQSYFFHRRCRCFCRVHFVVLAVLVFRVVQLFSKFVADQGQQVIGCDVRFTMFVTVFDPYCLFEGHRYIKLTYMYGMKEKRSKKWKWLNTFCTTTPATFSTYTIV